MDRDSGADDVAENSDIEINSSEGPDDSGEPFDFDAHRTNAQEEYRQIRGKYHDFAITVKDVLERSLGHRNVLVHSIEARAKEVKSFGKKAAAPHPSDPDMPKYRHPVTDITDLAGVRVITFFLSSVQEADIVIAQQFEVVERSNRGGEPERDARVGYQSIHYLVRLKNERLALPEYARFRDITAEIQVRTILQHAWAEIEHEIQYKAVDVVPTVIRRRFLALAGMLEIGDREFQALEDAHQQLQRNARESVASGDLANVEVTRDSLKAFLDQTYGIDDRMRDTSYDWTVRLLKGLGFTTLKQVNEAIHGYDDERISRIVEGSRMGQLTRFENVLLASMGENYIRNHPWYKTTDDNWFDESRERALAKLRSRGVSIGSYSPTAAEGD